MMTDDVDRLHRRAERERSARLQAERIAEQAIADLTEANRGLDEVVERRTADLEQALARLAAADEVKTTFLRGVAHEMSTPLHAVRGLLELIAETEDPTVVRASAKEAGFAAERLHDALRTLVEFAAVSGGTMTTEPETLTLGEYADAVAGRRRLGAARRGLLLVAEVSPDPGVEITIDPVRVDQIVDALVDNAVRFGRTRVDVEARADGATLTIVVTDDGPGPPADLGDDIFDAFTRGDRSHEGFGVGLTLARVVAEAMGGSLAHRPAGEAGGRFVAEIPLADRSAS